MMSTHPQYCQNCGTLLNPEAHSCPRCKQPVARPPSEPPNLPEQSAEWSRTPPTLPESRAAAYAPPIYYSPSRSSHALVWLAAAGIAVLLALVLAWFVFFGSLFQPSSHVVSVSPTFGALAPPETLPPPTLAPPTAVPTAVPPTAVILPTAPPTPSLPGQIPDRLPTVSLPFGLLFREDFTAKEYVVQNGWQLYDSATSSHQWQHGAFIMTSKAQGNLTIDFPKVEFDNYGVQVQAQLVSGESAEYGLVLRHSRIGEKPSFHLFGISTDGRYFFQKVVDGVWSDPPMIPYTDTSAINRGGDTNTLAALVVEGMIVLYINDIPVKVIADHSLAGMGHVGIFVLPGTNDHAGVAFRNFAILDPTWASTIWAPVPSPLTNDLLVPTFAAHAPTIPPPTNTSVPPTPKPTAHPTVRPTATLPNYGTLVLRDSFTVNGAGWPEADAGGANRYFQNGQYHIAVNAVPLTVVTSPDLPLQLGNFTVEVEVTMIDGDPRNAAGLVLREQDHGNYNAFWVSPNGGYKFLRVQDGRYHVPAEWTFPGVINEGNATNLLRVVARGDQFTCYINDTAVGTFTDSTFATGRPGVTAQTFATTSSSHFAFDNFHVWENGANTVPAASASPNTVTVFFTVRDGEPSGYVIDKQGIRHDSSAYRSITDIALTAGDRIRLQTDTPQFALMFDCGADPQAFTPCDFVSDSTGNLPSEIRVNQAGKIGILNISRGGNWGNPRPGHEDQRYPADPVLRIILGG